MDISHAIKVTGGGDLVFVSGMVAAAADGCIVGVGDIRAQTKQVCENLKAAMEEAGGTLDDICRVDVYVRNMEHFPGIPLRCGASISLASTGLHNGRDYEDDEPELLDRDQRDCSFGGEMTISLCSKPRLMIAALVASASFHAPSALAQSSTDYPNRSVQLVVSYPPGGTTDVLARVLAQGLAVELGKPVVVINRDGGAGSIGAAAVAQAQPDGYTLGFTSATAMALQPHFNLAYKFENIEPICKTFDLTFALAVPQDSPFRTVADVVAAAKKIQKSFRMA